MEHQRATSKSNRVFYPLIIIGLSCLVFGLSMSFSQGMANAAQITLAWDESYGAAGYKIYSGTASNNYTWVVDVGNTLSYTMANLTDGYTYYFAATAYDASVVESDYSAEISYNASIVPCSYSISPASASLNTSGGSGSISVTTQSGCAWSASSGVSWITITSGSSGTGSGTLAYTVTSNGGAARSVVSTIAGRSFTFSQAGTTQSYTINASAGSGGSISPTGSVSITSGSSRSFTITPASGYRVSSVTVNGSSIGAVTSYTFSNVTANHTIAAAFTANTSSPPAGYAYCSAENGICNFSGTRSVAYGANGIFVYRTATNTINCNNRTFGDPIPGTWKACYIGP